MTIETTTGMTARDLMTSSPACCTRETPLAEVARMMVEHNCGAIPVVDDACRPVGVITDRDIVCRAIANDRNPLELTAGDCMTNACVCVACDASVEHCCEVLEQNQIRRAIVVEDGRLCGMLAQADLARRSEVLGGEVVAAVSKPSERPSAVA